MKKILRPDGNVVVVDSIWNEERSKKREKQGRQIRNLNDGREFEIYKRYFESSDVDELSKKHGIDFSIEHEGGTLIVAVGRMSDPSHKD